MKRTRILGIDPGLRRTGFGVIDTQANQMAYVASGVIKTEGSELAARLGTIHRGITELVDTYQPDEATVEKVFVNVNPQSTLLLGHARGAAISALVLRDLPVHEYTALQLKQAVVGHGHADKKQIQSMVMHLLTLPGEPSTDAADGLACAICHINSASLTQRLQSSGVSARRRHGRLV